MADVLVENHGSIFVFQAMTAVARDWIDENVVNEETQFWGGGLVVEPRYVLDLTAGMREAGLEVE
jgi:hypothetical protein